MFNKRPDNSSIGTVKKNSNPDTMTNAEILQAIEIMMNAPEEEMNTDRIEEYLSILQSRAPVTEEYDILSVSASPAHLLQLLLSHRHPLPDRQCGKYDFSSLQLLQAACICAGQILHGQSIPAD